MIFFIYLLFTYTLLGKIHNEYIELDCVRKQRSDVPRNFPQYTDSANTHISSVACFLTNKINEIEYLVLVIS